jgi:energy-coupling factor transporter ATP-binding protein EcfA2
MRLVSAQIRGYGRLVDTKANFDSKVIAVVGPNESGKTTLLKALAFLNRTDALGPIERSRAGDVTGETEIVEVKFALDDQDRLSLKNLDLEELPRIMYASRKADGGAVWIHTEPWPQKAVLQLKKAVAVLERTAERKTLQGLVSGETVFGDPSAEGARDFRAELARLVHLARGRVERQQDNSRDDEAGVLAGELAEALVGESKADRLRDALKSARKWFEKDDPAAAVSAALWSRTPAFLPFDEVDRSLQSAYALEDGLLTSTPPALANMMRMAGLDLPALIDYRRSGDIARRDTPP